MNLLDLLYIPIGVLTAPLWLRKRRKGWDQRFGHVEGMIDDETPASDRPRVLLHAVSVGEVNALRALVPMLAEHARVFVSVTTDTGLARANALFGELADVSVVRYPLDCSWMVRRFLDTVRPDLVALVELEVWPNFIKACSERDIPIGIINGRISTRSFKGYKRIRPLLRPTFARLRFACVQSQQYADRISAMGVARDRVRITGSMKWDSISTQSSNEPGEKALEIAHSMGINLERPIVVAGSTGPGEEVLFHGAVPSDAQLVMAPRKTERFAEAARAVPGCVRRSSGDRGHAKNRFLLDTIGELSAVYELADLVIMGRSFNDQFGSDPVEAAGLGKPVLIGARYGDFEQSVGWLQEAGGLRVVHRGELGSVVRGLLRSPEDREAMGERARACVRARQGASAIHFEVLMGRVKSGS